MNLFENLQMMKESESTITVKVIFPEHYFDDVDFDDIFMRTNEITQSYDLRVKEFTEDYMEILGDKNNILDYLQYELCLNFDSPEITVLR